VSQDAQNADSPANAVTSDPVERESFVVDAYDGLPRTLKLGGAVVIIVALAVVLAVWHDFYFHWFQVHTGTVNESGPYYGFWSGFGSDLGEATIVVGIAAAWRHHNCHVKGCARIGRPVPGTPYIACPKHHPAHDGTKRAVSFETLVKAHERAKKENRAQ
jgi:hypothetical protein